MSAQQALADSDSEHATSCDNLSHAPKPEVFIEIAGQTHPGKIRANNEDQFLVARLAKSMRVLATSLTDSDPLRLADEAGYLMVVADGMGGAAAGEQASQLAVQSVEAFVLNTLKWFLRMGGKERSVLIEELRKAIERADREVIQKADADPSLAGMGTTLTVGYSLGTDLYVIHAGDCRAYLLREGTLHQITHDHTLAQLLVDSGALSPEAARTDRRRNVVTNVIGGPRPGVHAEIHKVCIADGDLLLICSDGLTEVVRDDAIREALAISDSGKSACQRLIDMALEAGGPDNITVVVARYHVEA